MRKKLLWSILIVCITMLLIVLFLVFKVENDIKIIRIYKDGTKEIDYTSKGYNLFNSSLNLSKFGNIDSIICVFKEENDTIVLRNSDIKLRKGNFFDIEYFIPKSWIVNNNGEEIISLQYQYFNDTTYYIPIEYSLKFIGEKKNSGLKEFVKNAKEHLNDVLGKGNWEMLSESEDNESSVYWMTYTYQVESIPYTQKIKIFELNNDIYVASITTLQRSYIIFEDIFNIMLMKTGWDMQVDA